MNSNRYHTNLPYRSQRGTALVIGLIMLTIITLLSVSAMRNTNIDSKIAVNHHLKELSFQAAENALAHLTSSEANESRPGIEGPDDAIMNYNYYQTTGVEHQPDLTADVRMELLEIPPPGKYKVRGYSLNLVALKYQADSVGRVVGTNTRTHNRMELLFMRN